jgi:thiamine transport system ATP-binding protein
MFNIIDLQYKYKNTFTYNLSMKKGEILAILGQSGSGKSTLLDLISGFLEPIKGCITLEEKELLGLSVEKRPVSILFQNYNIFEHLDVQTNILLGLQKNQKAKKEKVKNILKEVALEDFEFTIASKLSGGQQQRVAIARVLLRQEPILLLDEPFTGLDKKTKLDMLNLVQKITIKHKLYTIIVTHDTNDCKQIANKVYEIKNNKLLQSDLLH